MVALTFRYSDPAYEQFLTRRVSELHYTLAPARGSRLRSEGAIAEGVSAVDLTYGFDDGSRLRSAAAVAAGLNPRDPYALYAAPIYALSGLKQFTIMDNKKIILPIAYQSGGYTQPQVIPWSSATTINTATLNVRAFSDRGSMALDLYVNGVMVGAIGWDSFSGQQWKEISIDITGKIANGNNNFRTDYYVTWGVNLGTSASIYMDVLIDYTGDEPIIPPPMPPFDPTIYIWGGAIIIGGLLLYNILRPRGA